MLAAAEVRLSARVDELTDLRTRLETLEAARKERDDASWRSMVKMYEAMKPREAATIFNDLDPAVLLPVIDRMKETKAALVLAAMQPDRARRTTVDLADLRSKANAITGPSMLGQPVPNPPVASKNADGQTKVTPEMNDHKDPT